MRKVIHLVHGLWLLIFQWFVYPILCLHKCSYYLELCHNFCTARGFFHESIGEVVGITSSPDKTPNANAFLNDPPMHILVMHIHTKPYSHTLSFVSFTSSF